MANSGERLTLSEQQEVLLASMYADSYDLLNQQANRAGEYTRLEGAWALFVDEVSHRLQRDITKKQLQNKIAYWKVCRVFLLFFLDSIPSYFIIISSSRNIETLNTFFCFIAMYLIVALFFG